MNNSRVAVMLVVGLVAGTARAELPWQAEAHGRGDLEPRSYFAVVSVGGYAGYHDGDLRTGKYEFLDCLAWDARALECRLFEKRFGFGCSVADLGASATWNCRSLAVPSVSLLCITRNGSQSFDFAALEAHLLLYAPVGLGLAYTVVPFAPWPLECTARVGADFAVDLAFSEDWPGMFVPVVVGSWRVSFGVRAGLGWWVMREN